MAPLTRCRALGGVPQPNMVTYYSQRASEGGLVVSEATCVSETAHGYPCTPTLYTPAALEGWKPVVQAIHSKGGSFFMQLWHCGRASHPHYQPGEADPIAPSAVPITGAFKVFSPKTYQMADYPVPRAMTEDDISAVIASFATAARNALATVGADGVEIHAASGYIINQFLNSNANTRADSWGGGIENRCRFALEVTKAVIAAAGDSKKVGVRLSPFGHYLITPDGLTYATYTYLLTELDKLDLAYVHMVEPRSDDTIPETNVAWARPDSLVPFRQVYGGTMIVAGGHEGASAAEAVRDGRAEAVAFGRYFISTPDLPRVIALGAEPNPYDRGSFYTQDDKGYLDYPFLEDTPAGKKLLASEPRLQPSTDPAGGARGSAS
ncbi:MAG: putative 12-oxophytodienoic acid reductase [Monoraphidium minutum]|nr:MAG: putative 12-oxophytodienoic acid reductase [Monoraphidium minutum]